MLVAVVALALSGCGGGGGDSGQTTSSAAASAKPSGDGSEANGGRPGSAAKGAERPQQDSAGRQKGTGSTSRSPAAQNSAKHAKPITLPKGEPEPQATPAEQANATVVDIALQSPDVAQGGALPAKFTCDGKGSPPTLRWQGVPAATSELVILAMNVQPVQGKLFFDWALAGIAPGLEELESGTLPKGAVQGKNSYGKADYEICPPPGQAESYVFALYALPKALSPAQGFDPAALRSQAQAISRSAGLLAVSYGR